MTETMTFEQAFQELEQVVQQLERGTPNLDEALRLYEQGTRLASRCEQLLEGASLRVRQLQEQDDGSLTELDFHP